MIPTLLLIGLAFGRWWRVAIPAATVGWALLLAGTGVVSDLSHLAGAALFGFINVSVGVLMFQGLRALWLSVNRVISNGRDARS